MYILQRKHLQQLSARPTYMPYVSLMLSERTASQVTSSCFCRYRGFLF